MSFDVHHRELCDYLRSIGAERVRVEHSSKHPRIVFVWQGTERSYTTVGTLGDARAGQARETGRCQAEAETERSRSQQRHRCRGAIAELPSNWRDALAEHPAYCGGRNGDDL